MFFSQHQEEEREAQRKRQLELQQQAEQMRLDRERRLEEERGRFLEKAKQIIIEPVVEVCCLFSFFKIQFAYTSCIPTQFKGLTTLVAVFQ